MSIKKDTSVRKKDHIDICLNEDVSYSFGNGFQNYAFEHNAITEVNPNEISMQSGFFGKTVEYPFIISCMTGGTGDAKFINESLIEAATDLNIPIGVGSQRQVLENDDFIDTFTIFQKIKGKIPVLSNIGAAQVSKLNSVEAINRIIDIVQASSLVIHCNPLQESIQKEGEPNFEGLLKSVSTICETISVPVIVKEVGAGISKNAAQMLLDAGVKGIDVAGAGGTSWSAVELIRNGDYEDTYFRNWGLPTSYCLRTVNELRDKYDFTLISSGGIKTFDDIAKSIALGADFTASASKVLKVLSESGVEGVISYVKRLFDNVSRIMYLTGCKNIAGLKNINLIKKEELF